MTPLHLRTSSQAEDSVMEGSHPAAPAEPGTLNTSLVKLPRLDTLTEGVSAHPSQRQLDKLTHTLNQAMILPGYQTSVM